MNQETMNMGDSAVVFVQRGSWYNAFMYDYVYNFNFLDWTLVGFVCFVLIAFLFFGLRKIKYGWIYPNALPPRQTGGKNETEGK